MNNLLTASEIAVHLRVALPTIRIWTRKGGMPHLRLGWLIRYRVDDVIAWIEAGRP